MKKDYEHIAKKVQETLAAFDDAKQAKPRPYFYSRLKGRMENRASEELNEPYFSLTLRRVLAGIVVVLLALNALTLKRLLNDSTLPENVTDNATQAINEIYYPVTPTVFTIEENLTP